MEIQGNILAGFVQHNQCFLLVQFASIGKIRVWLNHILPLVTTTAKVVSHNEQCANSLSYDQIAHATKAVWFNVGFTRSGLIKTGANLGNDLARFEAFSEGPARRASRLRDRGHSDPTRWIVGGPNQPEVDAIATLAADNLDDLRIEIDKQRELAAKCELNVVLEQYGSTLPGALSGCEHFGFKDGISQPQVRGFHCVDNADPRIGLNKPGMGQIAPGEFVLGYPRQSRTGGDAPPHSCPDWMKNGSFQVFRRLLQDVSGWRMQLNQLSQSLSDDDGITADVLAAKLVGRWPNGATLAQSPGSDDCSCLDLALDNDFDFDDDQFGFKTPGFAHIRKMYPRYTSYSERELHRILRRSIPFGPPLDSVEQDHAPDVERGLLFNSFMASIEEQFEFLQQGWANNSDFFEPGDGPDPLVGEARTHCTLRRQGSPDLLLSFTRFVHTSGAIYAFVPSLTTLRQLAEKS